MIGTYEGVGTRSLDGLRGRTGRLPLPGVEGGSWSSIAMMNSVVADDLALIRGQLGETDRFSGAVVLVTGCGGFLGFYLLQYLVRHGAELGVRKVIGLDSFLVHRPSWLEDLQQEFPHLLEVRRFDISRDRIEAVDAADQASFVIHMASIASPTFYRQFPLETIDANVWGLRGLLDFYRGSDRLQGFLFFSSSEIYGDPPPGSIPTPESYRGNVSCLGPRACYDESKRFGETLCQVFAGTHGMPLRVVRPFNNYGPGLRLDDRHLPADFAKAVLEDRDIVILSDGRPTRTFCYVADAVAGYLKALLHGAFDCFNIGRDRPEIAVRDVAEVYRRAAGELFAYKGAVRYEPSADPDYLADNPGRRCPVIDKARRALGFEPQVGLEEGVRRYLRFLRPEAARA